MTRAYMVIVVLLFAALLVSLIGDTEKPAGELQVVVSPQAVVGTSLPVRAWVFDTDPAGGLLDVEVEAALHDAGARFDWQRMDASWLSGAEHTFDMATLPATDAVTVSVRALTPGPMLRVSKEVTLAEHLPPPPLLARSGPPPQPSGELAASVESGGCVAEQLCTLWVSTAPRVTHFTLEELAGVRVDSVEVPAQSSATPISIVVAGDQARLRIVAHSDAGPLQDCRLEIPQRRGSVRAALSGRLLQRGSLPQISIAGITGPEPVLVDLFHEGVWMHALSLPAKPTQPLPVSLRPGHWRAQVRTDPFSSDNAAALEFVVLDDPLSVANVAHVLQNLSIALPAPLSVEALPRAVAYAFSERETRIWSLPAAIRSSTQTGAEARQAQRRRDLWTALLILALGLVAAVLTIRAQQGGTQERSWPLGLFVFFIFFCIAAFVWYRQWYDVEFALSALAT